MQLTGVMGYVLTPFDEQGNVDPALLGQHVSRLIDLGVHGVAPLGSVGCLPYLNDAERDLVMDTTAAVVAGRVPILAGVSSLTTQDTIRHARRAEYAGAAAVQVLPSTYWKLTEAEIFRYYAQVAASVSIPVMVYNNPFTTGVDMPVALLQKLCQIENITLIKEASPDTTKITRLRQVLPDHVGIFVGLNRMARQGLLDGAAGWCTAAPNVCAAFTLGLYHSAKAGDTEGAAAWFARQEALLNFLMDHGLPRTITAGLSLCGVPGGHLRAPLAPLAPALEQELQTLLTNLETPR